MARLSTVLVVLVFVWSFCAVAPCNAWTVKDLGTLGGTQSMAYGVNSTGKVVGAAEISGGYSRAFRSAANGGTKTDLGVFAGGTTSVARAVNTSGQVAGYSTITDGYYRAFRTTSTGTLSTATNLQTFGGEDSFATGINDSGQVVGYSSISSTPDAGGYFRAFRTSATGTLTDGTATNLGVMNDGVNSYAYGINASGQVVGEADDINGTMHAFRYTTSMIDLGAFTGGTYSCANAISANGQVVGYSEVRQGTDPDYTYACHAFRTTAAGTLSDGTATDLGTLGGDFSCAHGVDSNGNVIGYSTLSNGDTHAFFYSTSGGMVDLNTKYPMSGWVYQNATAIWDVSSSWGITGYGLYDGVTHAFYISSPEPGSFVLLAIGAIGIFAWMRRKRRQQP